MSDAIHLFLHDPVFVDPTQLFSPAGSGGVGVLSPVSRSYFAQPVTVRDNRDTRDPAPTFGTDSRAQLVVDQGVYSSFLTVLQAASDPERGALFAILDRLVYRYLPSESRGQLDQALADGAQYLIYVVDTVSVAATAATGTVYASDGSTATIRVPDFVTFNVRFTNNGTPVEYEVTVWTNNAAFYAHYPISQITAVVPPLPAAQLLTGALTGTGANAFATAALAATTTHDAIATRLRDGDESGYATYTTRFYDSSGNSLAVPFNLLYKGPAPDRLQSRLAIRNWLLTSGVGTTAQWRSRAPECFIDARIYLIPQWGNSTTMPNQLVYPSVQNVLSLITNTKKVLSLIPSDFLEANAEVLGAAYDTMTLVAVPHELNASEKLSLRALHPTYRQLPSTDAAFQYMGEDTKSFAIKLNTVLAVAAAKATSTVYLPFTDRGAIYLPFDVAYTEFCVLTRESYRNIVGAG